MNYEQALVVADSPELKELAEEIIQLYKVMEKKYLELKEKFPLDINIYWSIVDGEMVPLRDTNLESYY